MAAKDQSKQALKSTRSRRSTRLEPGSGDADEFSIRNRARSATLPTKVFPWSRVYVVANPQHAELKWSVIEYTPTLKRYLGESVQATSGSVRAGNIIAITGPAGSAAEGMARIISGKETGFIGTLECNRHCVTAIEDITDFTYQLPDVLTVAEAVEFYMAISIPPDAGDRDHFKVTLEECLKEFGLQDVQNHWCSQLDTTHRKLLYLLSMLLNPLPIVVVHNAERYLEDDHCAVLSKRISALARGGHSVLICSTNLPRVFLDVCDFVHVFHQSGVLIYAGPPKSLARFLNEQGIPTIAEHNVLRKLFKVTCCNQKQLSEIKFSVNTLLVKQLPTNRELSFESAPSPCLPQLVRTLKILKRSAHLGLARLIVGFAFIFYSVCALNIGKHDASLNGVYALTIIDIVLMLTVADGLVFGFLEARSVDLLLIQEKQGVGQQTPVTVLLCTRIITRLLMELCASVLVRLIHILACCMYSITSVNVCVLVLLTCSLLYSFIGALCGLFKKYTGLIVSALLLLFVWSIALGLTPIYERLDGASPYWRFSSPLFLSKAILFSYGLNETEMGQLDTIMDFRLEPSELSICFFTLDGLTVAAVLAYLVTLTILLW